MVEHGSRRWAEVDHSPTLFITNVSHPQLGGSFDSRHAGFDPPRAAEAKERGSGGEWGGGGGGAQAGLGASKPSQRNEEVASPAGRNHTWARPFAREETTVGKGCFQELGTAPKGEEGDRLPGVKGSVARL
jgi:hypothetical protein